MSEPGSRRGRTHDAAAAREAILDAAEEVFAEHGFDGARIDAIAAAAGYNKSLIFQYFGDKLKLYAEVLRRADQQMSGLQTQLLAPLSEDETGLDADRVKILLESGMSAYFDFLVANPRITRIYNWELAEGWQTFAKIRSQRDFDDVNQVDAALRKVQSAGFLRFDVDPIIQLTTAVYLCQFYLGLIPLYQMLLPGEDFSSSAALARAREYLVEFVTRGMLVKPSSHKRAGAAARRKARSK